MQGSSRLDVHQEKLLRAYYGLLSRRGVFREMQRVLFPRELLDRQGREKDDIVDPFAPCEVLDVLDGGITHADIMTYGMDSVDCYPRRRKLVADLDGLLGSGQVATYHFGCKYRNDIEACARKSHYNFKSRVFCLDLDFEVLEKDYHLIFIDHIIETVTTRFMRGYDNPFDTLVCFSGGGWHLYFNNRAARRWTDRTRRCVQDYLRWVVFFDRDRDADGFLQLPPRFSWLADGTLVEEGEVKVFIPEDFLPLYRKYVDVVLNDRHHDRFLQCKGPVMSYLRMMWGFIQGHTRRLDVHFKKLVECNSVNFIFKWIDSFRIYADKCGVDNPFQHPERLKVTIFYMCVQRVMMQNKLIIDEGMGDPKHMLRGPFSFKFSESPRSKSRLSGYRFSGYPCLPLGTLNNIRKFKRGMTLDLDELARFEESGNEDDLPPQLRESLLAWYRFAQFSTPCEDSCGTDMEDL
jgi:hypothetical protein